MNSTDIKKHIEWLQHSDIAVSMASKNAQAPWFSAYRRVESGGDSLTWFSALVPPASISALLGQKGNWDLHLGDGGPAIWTSYVGGKEERSYMPNGDRNGIEPLVFCRTFHGIRDAYSEVSQEFRLWHNLYLEPSRNRLMLIDDDGDESEAVRYGDDFLEIRTDLLLEFCAVKQMALAIYVDGFRRSKNSLAELGLTAKQDIKIGALHAYFNALGLPDTVFEEEYKSYGKIVGKKYVLPGDMPPERAAKTKVYQEFIFGMNAEAKPVSHTCNPEMLENNFGKNADAPHYLTPVFFRPDVLDKYYAQPDKYSVEDGYLRCTGLWGLQIDNDQTDCVVVFLGDLGRDLSEKERNYWLSFNIPPAGKKISETAFKRGFLADFASPQKPDLVFKQEYQAFNRSLLDLKGWHFFLPFHGDDEHFFTSLHMLSKDNQAEFDAQLIALTKVLVDSLNEREITRGLKTLAMDDKGITKLEKFFVEGNAIGFEPHVKFLRGLQDLRSKSAAHRKGSSYDKLIDSLQMADEGQQRVNAALFVSAIEFIRFLKALLIPTSSK